MRELILIRTHFFCEATERFYDFLKRTSGRDVAIVCDETNGVVDIGAGKVKISITADFMQKLGLHVPSRFGWLCGDYFLYAGSQLLSGYDRYWMIESDVRMNFENASEFFDAFAEDASDLLAFHMYKSSGTWYWHSPMSYFTQDVYACLFPVVAISKKAVDFAFAERLKMSSNFDNIVPKDEKRRWPNDESFLISTLMKNGFSTKSLNSPKRAFTNKDTFGVGLPKSDAQLHTQSPDGMIYHPVQAGERFVNKANSWLTSYINRKATKEKLQQLFDDTFLAGMRLESSEDEFRQFEARLATAVEGAAA